MANNTTRGPLQADAARFLKQFGAAFTVPPEVFDDVVATARYLEGERDRLGAVAGASLLGEPERAVITADHTLRDGVAVRSYLPRGDSEVPRPVALFIHGGGWVTGSIDQHDTTCRILAVAADMVVVNVGYRLAPEHPYPGPLDDCDRALQWTRSVAGSLFGADPSRIAVVGASSGGNLAAALAMRARDRRLNEIDLQVLLYPALDSQMSSESYEPEVNGRDYFINANHMRWYWDLYRAGGADDDDPYFSPLASTDLSGLPAAVIVSAEFDLLRDDAIKYDSRLRAAGVASERRHHQSIHGFLALFDFVAEAYPEVGELGRVMRARLDKIERERPVNTITLPPAIDVAARVESGTLESLDLLARWNSTNVETIRASYEKIPRRAVPASGDVSREDGIVVAGGGRTIPVRWYRPRDVSGPLPVIVYIHGGAYIMGTLDENDERLEEFVRRLGCAVVSVDYRLAPENPYPAGLDDVEAVWRALSSAHDQYDVDPNRMVVAGSSAGAGLAASLCIRLKECNEPQPLLQVLVYPMLDDREWPSIAMLEGGPGHWGLWQIRQERLSWEAYLGDAGVHRERLAASAIPGRADPKMLVGLAPAFIGIGDVDALIDSNLRFAANLIAAGVSTELHTYPGVIHGGFLPHPRTQMTRKFLADVYEALARALR
ncbi:alpha/beta hydrolase [Arthrobacter sp. D1-29]